MARAGKARIRGKARTRRTSPVPAKSGKDETLEQYVAEVKPELRESQNETGKELKPAKPDLETEIMEYLRFEEGNPSFCKIYEVLSQYLKTELPESFAKTTALRKLVESKDASMRIYKVYNKRKEQLTWVVKYSPKNDTFAIAK